MLLSTASTVFFYIGIALASIGVLALLISFADDGMDDDARVGLGGIGLVVAGLGGLLFGLIMVGGIKAQNIQDGLSNQGLTVVSIDTDNNRATVVDGDKLVDVQVYKTGYPQAYHAYLACPVDVNLAVSLDNCAAVPK